MNIPAAQWLLSLINPNPQEAKTANVDEGESDGVGVAGHRVSDSAK